MAETKEKILLAALRLFAESGYEAVSVSRIAGELGMTKGALYKHYAGKRDIFESVVERMARLDAERAGKYELPKGTLDETRDEYEKATADKVTEFSRSQFRYWTEEELPRSFRRMLTLEQYRSEEMRALYQQYLVSGPLQYLTDLFSSLKLKDARKRAIGFYAPMLLFYGIYDGASDKEAVVAEFEGYFSYLSDSGYLSNEREAE